jgi:hypothetical protein
MAGNAATCQLLLAGGVGAEGPPVQRQPHPGHGGHSPHHPNQPAAGGQGSGGAASGATTTLRSFTCAEGHINVTVLRGPPPVVDDTHNVAWVRARGASEGNTEPHLLAFTDIHSNSHYSGTGSSQNVTITITMPHIYMASELNANPQAHQRVEQHERGHDPPWFAALDSTLATLRSALDYGWSMREAQHHSLGQIVSIEMHQYSRNLNADLNAAANRWDAQDYPRIDADFRRFGYTPPP